MPRRTRRRSFTLLELMIAFVIMAILSAVAIPSMASIASNDHGQADVASALALADAAYYKATATDSTGSGLSVADYASISGSGLRVTLPITSDSAGLVAYPTVGPFPSPAYFNFADGLQVAITVGDGTDSAPLPTASAPTTIGGGTTTTSPVTTTTSPPSPPVELIATNLPDYSPSNDSSSLATAISCSSPGNCASVGYAVAISGGNTEAMVVNQVGGTYQPGQVITAPYSATPVSYLDSVSCPSDNNCVAAGTYFDASSSPQAFMVQETDGTWGTAVQLGSDAVPYGYGTDGGVSCTSTGNCSIAFTSENSSSYFVPQVITETSGTWGSPVSTDPSETTVQDEARSYACSSPGNCVLGGLQLGGTDVPFVITETSGVWGPPLDLVSSLAVNGGNVNSVACASDANCVVGGFYSNGLSLQQGFIVDEVAGVWQPALTISVPSGGSSNVTSVSCSATAGCAAAGELQDGLGGQFALVADESAVGGTWNQQQVAPATSASAMMQSVSCASSACTATGISTDTTGLINSAYATSETSGSSWSSATDLMPGFLGNNGTGPYEQVSYTPISCSSATDCSMSGQGATIYDGAYSFGGAIATSEVSGTWGP